MLSQENRVRLTSVIFIGGLREQAANRLDEYDFADDLSIDQRLHRFDRIAQRIPAPDAGFELTLRGQFEQRLGVGGSNFGTGLVEAANPHADRFDSLDQEIVSTGECRRTAEK